MANNETTHTIKGDFSNLFDGLDKSIEKFAVLEGLVKSINAEMGVLNKVNMRMPIRGAPDGDAPRGGISEPGSPANNAWRYKLEQERGAASIASSLTFQL